MKTLLTLFVLLFSSSVVAETIILDCKCQKVYFYETNNYAKCFQGDNIIEIDLTHENIEFLDNNGKKLIKRITENEGVIEVTAINSSQIEYVIAFNVSGKKDVLRINTINRYNGVKDEMTYLDGVHQIDTKSICKKTDALF
ncbi:hypothetical protein OAJ30_01155 [Alphaproteobacteria bacterium]|nr:hypothetical protein [Alphaproteobacteria bacterium]